MMQVFETINMFILQIIVFLQVNFTTIFLITVFPGFLTIVLAAAAIIWFERKFLAKMQLRVGPQYAGRIGGIFQPIADFLKLIFKEGIIPKRADSFFYQLAPLLIVTLAAVTATVIPVGPNAVIANLQFGLLFIFAIGAIFPVLAFLTAWASNSVYPFLGGLRALLQMIAYEVPLWLSALGVVILAGSFNLVEIVLAQNWLWFAILMPLGAIIFFIALLVEIERLPFDLPEAEPEIVTGYMSEYSGMNFGLMMMSQYLKLYLGALLFTTLFLGGWLMPPFITNMFPFIPPFVWTLLKTAFVVVLFLIPRGIYPRVKISLLLRLGWNRLFLLAIVNLFLVVGIMIFFGGIP
ncbi:MAG: NADH-quinone oxidoreductase subunit NuoH [Promethearchaeota archaeon]